MDQQNTLGLGENIVFANGTDSDSLIGFDPATEEFRRIRIPYPLNTYTRGLDGRIDDPDAGGRAGASITPTAVNGHGAVPTARAGAAGADGLADGLRHLVGLGVTRT